MWNFNPYSFIGSALGYAAPRVVDQAVTGDADWVHGVSVNGGARNTASGALVGPTSKNGATGSWTPTYQQPAGSFQQGVRPYIKIMSVRCISLRKPS